MVNNHQTNGHGPVANGNTNGDPHPNGCVHTGGDQYLPRSILITGGAGFIASHVVTQLLDSHPQYKVREFSSHTCNLPPQNLKLALPLKILHADCRS